MQLTLDPLDLNPEWQKNSDSKDVIPRLSCSQVKFDHFNDDAKKAIRAVGRAVYYTWDRQNYNAIYPPKVKV